jgi:guanine deaminase
MTPSTPILADPIFMQKAIDLATGNVATGGGPFGAVIVRDGQILATGVNSVARDNDPTAHAEIVAIRSACRALDSFRLTGCVLYSSCEPCPMCLAAAYWSRCSAIFYGNSSAAAAQAGFHDALFYAELQKPLPARSIPTQQLLPGQAIASFHAWLARPDRIDY